MVAGTWAFRAESERRAERRFRRLAAELQETGANPVVVDMAVEAIEDEARHAIQCDEVAAYFGWPASTAVVPEPAPLGPGSLSPVQRLLFEVMAFCAFTETLNAAMLVHSTSNEARTRDLRISNYLRNTENSWDREVRDGASRNGKTLQKQP